MKKRRCWRSAEDRQSCDQLCRGIRSKNSDMKSEMMRFNGVAQWSAHQERSEGAVMYISGTWLNPFFSFSLCGLYSCYLCLFRAIVCPHLCSYTCKVLVTLPLLRWTMLLTILAPCGITRHTNMCDCMCVYLLFVRSHVS